MQDTHGPVSERMNGTYRRVRGRYRETVHCGIVDCQRNNNVAGRPIRMCLGPRPMFSEID